MKGPATLLLVVVSGCSALPVMTAVESLPQKIDGLSRELPPAVDGIRAASNAASTLTNSVAHLHGEVGGLSRRLDDTQAELFRMNDIVREAHADLTALHQDVVRLALAMRATRELTPTIRQLDGNVAAVGHELAGLHSLAQSLERLDRRLAALERASARGEELAMRGAELGGNAVTLVALMVLFGVLVLRRARRSQ